MNKSLFCLGLMVAWLAPVFACGEWTVWTVKPTQRVLREDPAGRGTAVSLSAARNEWEGFQILMRCDAPVKDVQLKAGSFTGTDGKPLEGVRSVLYRQHQLYLADPTIRNDAFKPGWYPDPLIPVVHPQTGKPLRGARFSAMPFDVPAEQTHGFWVDVYVPAQAKAGQYRAKFRVTAAEGQSVEVPVTLNVWDFELPATPAMYTALGSPAERMRAFYAKQEKAGKLKPPGDWSAVEGQVAQMLSEHRINATPAPGALLPEAQPDGTYRIAREQIKAFREFVDRYHINAYPIGHARSVVKDPDAERPKLQAWLAAWDRAIAELDRAQVVFYMYLKDEPNDEEAYRYVQKWGRAIRATKTAVKMLVVEQTWTQNEQWGDLYGAVDIWCPLFSLFKEESAVKRQALGEMVWTYTALCQRDKTPWWHIDYPLLNYRVPAWIAWRYRIRGLLYWGGMVHWSGVEDPWSDPKTLDRRNRGKGQLYNGEGTIVYPGRDVGYEGIAPSLRLKALRDSVEDYEYLALLERMGKATEAQKIILPLAGSWFQWEQDPAAYEAARGKLAQLIVGGGKK